MTRIYGVDPDKKVTPVMVRDAIIRCFVLAHRDVLEKMKEYGDVGSKQEFEKTKKLDVEILIKKMFSEVGGDFDNPTRESIVKVCDKLAEFSKSFRRPEIIKRHYGEIMKLINKMEQDSPAVRS